MTDDQALIAAVCDRPDDDTPRLVLADWCDDQGGPGLAARAAFIRAQVKLSRLEQVDRTCPHILEYARPDPGPMPVERWRSGVCECRGCGLTREAAEAFAAMPMSQRIIQGGELLAGWSVEFCDPRLWHRGFPATIRDCGSVFWRDHHAAILAAAPIRRVELVDVPEVTFGPVRERATSRVLERLTDIRADWAATWGDSAETFRLVTTITPEMAYSGGEFWLHRRIEQHRAEVEEARTPLGYLRARWPKVGFVLPSTWQSGRGNPLADLGHARRLIEQFSVGGARPPALLDPRAFIRQPVV